MIVEVVAVGTELLLGQIVNRNAAFVASCLAEAGLDAHYQVVVGDNLERLTDAIVAALDRADALILTGGLGPTPDDLTREGLSAATGRPMEFDQVYADELRRRFEAIGRDMPSNNLRQAEYPRGAETLPNPKGTAPGLALTHDGTLLFAIPGVPAEMREMLNTQVLPRLRQAAAESEALVSRVLRTWGHSESGVAEALDDLYVDSINPSLAFLASAGEIKVRITAKAPTRNEAEEMIAPLEADVRGRLGSAVYGVDDETVEQVLIDLLETRGWTLGSAESATAGMVAARITQIAGSSTVFRGAIVSYATDLKIDLLGVSEDLISDHGVVSQEVALRMAEGAREVLDCDVAVSVTGSAGPDELEEKAGTMIVAVHTPEAARARTLNLPGDRERVRAYTATAALQLCRLAVTGAWWRT